MSVEILPVVWHEDWTDQNTKDYQFEAEGLLSTCPRKSQYTVYLTKFLGYPIQIVTWLVCPFNRILFAGLWCHKTHF